MKTIFERADYDEPHERIDRLAADANRAWGKMSPAQMMEHCARVLEMATGKKPVKQLFVGKMLSWMFKKEFLGEAPFKPDRPTGTDFKIKDEPNFEATRLRFK